MALFPFDVNLNMQGQCALYIAETTVVLCLFRYTDVSMMLSYKNVKSFMGSVILRLLYRLFALTLKRKIALVLHWFCFTTLCDLSRKLAPPSQPNRYKSKTNHDFITLVFPRLRLFTCIFFEFSLAPWDILLCLDWPS